jgi:hypothetical protein
MSSFAGTEKRPHANSANPLCNRGILDHVLGYVGPGHWLFLALVNEEWQQAYLRVPSIRIRIVDELRCEDKLLVYPPQMTLARAAFASQSRLRLAHESGFSLAVGCESSQQFIAGRYADEEALAAAQELGLVLSEKAVVGAAEAGCLHKVQWLCQQLSVSAADLGNLTSHAVKGGSVAVLSWLAELDYSFDTDDWGAAWSESACRIAAANGHLEALQWLRQSGYPWGT